MLSVFSYFLFTWAPTISREATRWNEDESIVTGVTDLQTYHFIIVGCGTSGGVLASRLSENPSFNVVCIEKGPRDLPSTDAWNDMNIPNDFNFISTHDPVVITTQQKLRNKPIYIPTAMGLGGTSKIYGMISVRPSPEPLANWPKGWRYDDFLPFYKKLEDHYCYYDNTNISREECELYHDKGGPMQVNSLDLLAFHRLGKAFTEICNDTN
jgi:choline dehydrogenase